MFTPYIYPPPGYRDSQQALVEQLFPKPPARGNPWPIRRQMVETFQMTYGLETYRNIRIDRALAYFFSGDGKGRWFWDHVWQFRNPDKEYYLTVGQPYSHGEIHAAFVASVEAHKGKFVSMDEWAWWYPGRSRCYGICFSYEAARALAKNCPRNHAGFSGWQAKKEVA